VFTGRRRSACTTASPFPSSFGARKRKGRDARHPSGGPTSNAYPHDPYWGTEACRERQGLSGTFKDPHQFHIDILTEHFVRPPRKWFDVRVGSTGTGSATSCRADLSDRAHFAGG